MLNQLLNKKLLEFTSFYFNLKNTETILRLKFKKSTKQGYDFINIKRS
jgi:hypothetical protein